MAHKTETPQSGLDGQAAGYDSSRVWGDLVAANTDGQRPPLICCTAGFLQLAHYLGPDQPLYAISMEWDGLATLDHRTAIRDLAAYYLEKISAVQPTGPYLLAGFAEGGILVFEIAQQLHAGGQEVALLALLDAPCPGSYKPCPQLARIRYQFRKLISLPHADRGLTLFAN